MDRESNRSWCHRHITSMIKLFWSQPMVPWAAIKKASQKCGGDTSSCPGPYPTAACPGCRLGRELFTLPVYYLRCPWSHGLRAKKLYHTRIVAVTSAPVLFPIQRPLVPSFTKARSETFQTILVNIKMKFFSYQEIMVYGDLLFLDLFSMDPWAAAIKMLSLCVDASSFCPNS